MNNKQDISRFALGCLGIGLCIAMIIPLAKIISLLEKILKALSE